MHTQITHPISSFLVSPEDIKGIFKMREANAHSANNFAKRLSASKKLFNKLRKTLFLVVENLVSKSKRFLVKVNSNLSSEQK